MQCAIQCLDVIDRRLKGNINIITLSTDLQLLMYVPATTPQNFYKPCKSSYRSAGWTHTSVAKVPVLFLLCR